MDIGHGVDLMVFAGRSPGTEPESRIGSAGYCFRPVHVVDLQLQSAFSEEHVLDCLLDMEAQPAAPR